ncbi:hypothetical protein GCM10020219_036700 [Nonomuraea dietziae]
MPFVGRQVGVADDHVAQLLGRHLLPVGVGVAAEQLDDAVGGLRQGPDDGPGQTGQPVKEGRDDQGQPLGPLPGQAFGRELAEHQRQVGDGQCHQDQRDGLGESSG